MRDDSSICVICCLELDVADFNSDSTTEWVCVNCVATSAEGLLSKTTLPIPTECLGLRPAIVGLSMLKKGGREQEAVAELVILTHKMARYDQ